MMQDREIIYGEDINSHILNGIEKIYVPVSSTLGSHGKYVAIQEANGKHRFTKDGVSVAHTVNSPIPAEDVFIRAVADASLSTLSKVGDGTTSTVILTYNMVKNMLSSLKSEVKDRKQFFKGIDDAMQDLEKFHAEMKPTEAIGLDELTKVAITSSNGDEKFGKILGEIYHKIGSEGIVNIKYHDINEITTEYADGYIVDGGILSKEWMNSNGSSIIENPRVLVTNREITSAEDFLRDILTPIHSIGDNRPVFVVAGGYSVEVLQTIMKNMDKIFCLPIKAPSMADARNSYLEDLAHITGSVFVDGEKDMHLDDYRGDIFSILGSCVKVEAKIEETVVSPSNKPDADYMKKLEGIAENSDSEYAKEFTLNRIAKLNGFIVTLFLKKATSTEMSLDYDRYDDAIKATRNATKNGVLSGGGSSYIRLREKCLNDLMGRKDLSDDYVIGYKNITNSLLSVLKVNLENSNHSDEEYTDILFGIENNEDKYYMYDTVTQSFGNAFDLGVLESYMSSIVCIRNAFGVSKVIVNTGSAIVPIPNIL